MGSVIARLSEPSTWASVSVLLALVGVNIPADTLGLVMQAEKVV